MSYKTPYAPVLNGVPHLGRAEAVLYLVLYYVFGVLHPRYAVYIDALAQHERLETICQRAGHLDVYLGQSWRVDGAGRAALWRETDLPEIYFALLFAWRCVRPYLAFRLSALALTFRATKRLDPG